MTRRPPPAKASGRPARGVSIRDGPMTGSVESGFRGLALGVGRGLHSPVTPHPPAHTDPMHRFPHIAPVLVLITSTLAVACGTAPADGPEAIAPPTARVGDLPFSPAIRAGDYLFLSGAIGIRPGTLQLVSTDVGEQTRQTLDNLAAVLAAAGSGLEDVVKCTVFLVDMDDYEAMNAAYAAVWPGSPPARSTVAGSGLALGARVEIECIAWAPR